MKKYSLAGIVFFLTVIVAGLFVTACSKNTPSEPLIVKETVIVIASYTFTPTITVSPTNSPDYTATFTPTPTVSNTFIVLIATFTHTFTITATPSITETMTFTFTVTESSTGTDTATITLTVTPTFTVTKTPDSSLITYYPMNGNANDASGNANDGTVNGAVLVSDRFGNADSAYYFDGINNYISSAKTSGQFGLTGNISYSIALWVKFEPFPVTNNWRILAGWGGDNNPGKSTNISLNTNAGHIGFVITNYSDLLGSVMSNGQWYHITAVYDSNTYTSTLYINGIFNVTSSGVSPINLVNSRFILGMPDIPLGTYQPLNAALDEVRFYNRALSAAEVSAIYSE